MKIAKVNLLVKQAEAKARGEKYDQYDQCKKMGQANGKPKKNPYKRTKRDLLMSQVDQQRVLSHQLSREGFDVKVPERHSSKCAVCNAEKDILFEVETMYMAFVNPIQISKHLEGYDLKISADSIRGHCVTFSLDKKRIQNTDAIMDTLLERGMIALDGKQVFVDVRNVISLLKLRLEKNSEIGRGNNTVNVVVNTPETKDARKKALYEGLGKFGVVENKDLVKIETKEK